MRNIFDYDGRSEGILTLFFVKVEKAQALAMGLGTNVPLDVMEGGYRGSLRIKYVCCTRSGASTET